MVAIFEDYQMKFRNRLRDLRKIKGVDANAMSEAMGNHDTYISQIETGAKQPSMNAFYYICQYLEVSPKDFFDFDNDYPLKFLELLEDFKALEEEEVAHAVAVIKALRVSQEVKKLNKNSD